MIRRKKHQNSITSKSANQFFENKLKRSKTGGQTIQNDSFFSQQMGMDISNVKVHTNSDAIQMNQQIGARAFTHGNDVYFNKGEYQPGTPRGKKLIAHELTHVAQQKSGAKRIQRTLDPNNLKQCNTPEAAAAGFTQSDIIRHFSEAIVAAKIAKIRLNMLLSLPLDAREAKWNSEYYKCWFGKYDYRRFWKVMNRVERIKNMLDNSDMKVRCNPKSKIYGRAWSGIKKIMIGKLWASTPSERTQTFAHETAHIVGLIMLREKRTYGRQPAKDLADKHPNAAMRSAENFGYFIVDSLFPAKTKQSC